MVQRSVIITSARHSVTLPEPTNHLLNREVERCCTSADHSIRVNSVRELPGSALIRLNQDKNRAWRDERERAKSPTGEDNSTDHVTSSSRPLNSFLRSAYHFHKDMMLEGTRDNIRVKTCRIRREWNDRNRKYVRTGVYARGTAHSKRLENAQWLTFEGDSPGLIQAFTDTDVIESPRFYVEAEIGKQISRIVSQGTRVRIGNNGKLVTKSHDQLEEIDFYDRCDEAMMITRGEANKAEPLFPPLCLSDLESNGRVITARGRADKYTNLHSEQNTTKPVVFHAAGSQVPYEPPASRYNTEQLERLLAKSPSGGSVTRREGAANTRTAEEKPTPTYEEVLHCLTPLSSKISKTQRTETTQSELIRIELGSSKPANVNSPAQLAHTQIRPTSQSLRASLARQCSVPSTPRPSQSVNKTKLPSSQQMGSRSQSSTVHRPSTSRDTPRPQAPGRAVNRTGEVAYVSIISPIGGGEEPNREALRTAPNRNPLVAVDGRPNDTVSGRMSDLPSSLTMVHLVGKPTIAEKRREPQFSRRKLVNSAAHDQNEASWSPEMDSELTLPPDPMSASRLEVNIPIMDVDSASSIITNQD